MVISEFFLDLNWFQIPWPILHLPILLGVLLPITDTNKVLFKMSFYWYLLCNLHALTMPLNLKTQFKQCKIVISQTITLSYQIIITKNIKHKKSFSINHWNFPYKHYIQNDIKLFKIIKKSTKVLMRKGMNNWTILHTRVLKIYYR